MVSGGSNLPGMSEPDAKPSTLAAQAMGWVDPSTRAVIPPIHTATTFIRDPDNQYRSGRSYARADNPTFDHAEALLARARGRRRLPDLRLGHGGGDRRVFQALAPGDHVVAPNVMYWGLRRWLTTFGRERGLAGRPGRCQRPRCDRRGAAPGQDEAGLDRDAGQSDLGDHRHRRRGGARARRRRAARGRQHRGDAGADPAARARRRPRDAFGDQVPERPQRRGRRRAGHGAQGRLLAPPRRRCATTAARSSGPFEAWLLLRGMRTLPSARRARLPHGGHAGRAPGRASRGSPRCSIRACRVTPAMPSRRARCRAASAACCRSASRAASRRRSPPPPGSGIWKRATSLGGVESLIEHRASVEGPGTPAPPDLLRLSVGIEDADDLLADLDQALGA